MRFFFFNSRLQVLRAIARAISMHPQMLTSRLLFALALIAHTSCRWCVSMCAAVTAAARQRGLNSVRLFPTLLLYVSPLHDIL